MSARALLYLALAAVLVACGGRALASPTVSPSTSGALPVAELKYRVMDAGGRIEFCDPDYYPVARADEEQVARQRIGDIQKDTDTYAAITKRVGTDTLAVYREWKALNALVLAPGASPLTLSFDYRATATARGGTPAPKGSGTRVEGTVDSRGAVAIARRTDAGPLNCPICLALGTRIATPSGEIAVEDLRVGDVVWTLAAGARVAAPLVAAGRTAVPATHEVVRLALSDGRIVFVSPGHPTADGRRVGDLIPGDVIDGTSVASADRVAYTAGFTFDILPAGATGAYWANGVLLGSTLR